MLHHVLIAPSLHLYGLRKIVNNYAST